MFKFIKKSMLLKNILSSAGIVLLVVLVITISSYQYSSTMLTDAIEKELEAVLETTKSKIEGMEQIIESEMKMLSSQQTIRIYSEVPEGNVRTIFRDYIAHNEGIIESIYIIDTEGQVYIDSENKRLKELDLSENPAYIAALSGSASWSDVMPSSISEQDIIICMIPIMDSEGKVEGVLASNYYFDLMRQVILDVQIGEEGYAYAVDSQGYIVAHPDGSKVATKIQALNIPVLTEASLKMMAGDAGVVSYALDGIKKTNYYDSIGRLSLSVNASESDYLKPLDQLATIQWVIGIVFFLVGALLSVIMAMFTIRKIHKIEQAMGQVAQGDLTAYVQFKKGQELDEVGQIGLGLNKMLDSIKAIIVHIKLSSESLASASQQLSASADQNRKASEETANSMQEIAEGAERQVNVMVETTERFDTVDMKMNASASEANSMAHKSEEVKTTANNGRQVISGSKTIMDGVKDLSVHTVKAMNDLTEKSGQIGEINSIIAQIAEQTNLLALNAAIEAARAGEQGKGFAVVADEIRKLAAQSQSSAQGIQDLIVEIQSKVEDASKLIQDESNMVDQGIRSVVDSEEAFGQINHTIVGVVQHIEEVVRSINDTMASTGHVHSAIEEVVSIVHETSASSEAIAASSQEQMAVSQEISSSASQLAQMAEDLLQAVVTFKTE